MNICKENPNNFNPDGTIKYFWVNYGASMGAYEKRREILKFADELPTEIAIKLKKDDELAEYKYSVEQRKKDKIKSFMRSSGFENRYQKAIKKIRNGKIASEEEFAEEQLEEQENRVRQKRLSSSQRTRRITIEEMILEIDNIIKNAYDFKDKVDKNLYQRMCQEKIDFDDVIQLLTDVVLTEDEAKCVEISWTLSKQMKDKDITDDILTIEQVIALFPELNEKTDVNKKSAEIITKQYNSYIERKKQQRAKAHVQKVEKLKTMRKEEQVVQLLEEV